MSYCWWNNFCTTWHVWNLANNWINYLSTGADFFPSTVWMFLFENHYPPSPNNSQWNTLGLEDDRKNPRISQPGRYVYLLFWFKDLRKSPEVSVCSKTWGIFATFFEGDFVVDPKVSKAKVVGGWLRRLGIYLQPPFFPHASAKSPTCFWGQGSSSLIHQRTQDERTKLGRTKTTVPCFDGTQPSRRTLKSLGI